MWRHLFRGMSGAFVIGALFWGLLVAAVYLYGQRDAATSADAIVVLGAAQYDGRPSPVLRARLDHAIALYRQGVAPVMIMTGGVGAGDTVSEAVVARRYAIRAGVPAAAILTEKGGQRSVESMRAVAQLMRSHRLRSAILVSDPFHALRLRLLSFQLGIKASTSPTRTSPISSRPREEWRFILRESGSIVLMLLPGDP